TRRPEFCVNPDPGGGFVSSVPGSPSTSQPLYDGWKMSVWYSNGVMADVESRKQTTLIAHCATRRAVSSCFCAAQSGGTGDFGCVPCVIQSTNPWSLKSMISA